MATILTTTQQVRLAVKFLDAKGNEAAIDGLARWGSSDETVAVVQPSADGKSAVAKAVGIGLAQITARGDADVDPGEEREVVATHDLDVRAAEAVTAGITAGEPEEQ